MRGGRGRAAMAAARCCRAAPQEGASRSSEAGGAEGPGGCGTLRVTRAKAEAPLCWGWEVPDPQAGCSPQGEV